VHGAAHVSPAAQKYRQCRLGSGIDEFFLVIGVASDEQLSKRINGEE
jgi:hypothetical protein